jgi:hypothetical protein
VPNLPLLSFPFLGLALYTITPGFCEFSALDTLRFVFCFGKDCINLTRHNYRSNMLLVMFIHGYFYRTRCLT